MIFGKSKSQLHLTKLFHFNVCNFKSSFGNFFSLIYKLNEYKRKVYYLVHSKYPSFHPKIKTMFSFKALLFPVVPGTKVCTYNGTTRRHKRWLGRMEFLERMFSFLRCRSVHNAERMRPPQTRSGGEILRRRKETLQTV